MPKKGSGNVVRLKVGRKPRADATAPVVPSPADGAVPLAPPPVPERGPDDIHPMLERQLLEAADPRGKMQLRKLIEIVSRQYDAYENDRTSLETVMRLASDEASAITERLEREGAARLQAILDHVKDGIISVDEEGRIESMNRTAERFFGVRQSDVFGERLDTLLPDLAPGGDVAQALGELATSQENTHYDLAAREVVARHRRGDLMPAEILVSQMQSRPQPSFIVCVRDTAERTKAEEALKDSEARYRVLVENAPEAVVVLDVNTGRFVDCNENAVHFFGMSREELLKVGPEAISPAQQADGTPSFGVTRGHVQQALEGGAPVFEWLHKHKSGKIIPCEVRFVRLPSSSGSLIRASVIDITERKQAELIAAGERRALEKIASSEPLAVALTSITEVVERVLPQSLCCVRIYDPVRRSLHHVVGPSLPREYVALMDEYPAEIRFGSCGAAVALQRQIIVPDIAKDALWEYRREAALGAGLRACWSTPITAGGRILGTFATYLRRTGMPSRRDLELVGRMAQLAKIAIERRLSEDALRESERRFRGLFENVVEGVYQVTMEGYLLSANPALIEMLGYESLEELRNIGTTGQLYVDPHKRAQLVEQLVRDGELVEAEYELRRKDGSVITITENARLNRDERGEPTGFEGTVTDITERKRVEQRFYQEKERAEVTLQSIADGVITTDRAGTVDYVNPVAEKMTGWPAGEACGRNITEIVKLVADGGKEPVKDPVQVAIANGEPLHLADQTALVSRRGIEVPIQATVAPIRDRSGHTAGAVIVFSDVSRERRMKRLLSYQAAHDALTGLINRREFESRLNSAIESARGDSNLRHAMIYVDLDQFKVVNDTCGHPAGDQLLRQVTGLLQSRVRAHDVLARLGGDEFGVLLEHCTPEQALRIADSLRQAIHDLRFQWGSNTMQIGASIGIVEINHHTESVATLLSAADIACYSAKDGGRNRVQVYDPASASARHREMRWMSRLTNARDEGRLDIVFQPIVRVSGASKSRPHYELLLRLLDENGSIVLPDEFIPAAERYNLMPSLDRWVVEKVLRDIVPSTRDGVEEAAYTVAVNLSGTTLSDPSFLEFLVDALESHEPTPGALCFEVTETAAITNLGHASYLMREMASRGCLIALDDFGSGLSSFNYLRTLPVHYLKIDGKFVQNVASDPIDRSMVEAIVQIGKAIGIETVAERVETAEVLEMLRQIGVSYAQGYLCGRPAPIANFPHRK